MKPLQRRLLRHEVADHLRTLIRKEYKPGDRLPSEAKLCSQLQVSLVTLREALSILAHECLIVRKHGSGTYVAENIDQPVAVLIDLDISQPGVSQFFIRLVQQVRARLEEACISTRLYVGHARTGRTAQEESELTCREFLEDLQQNRFRGVVAVSTPPIPQVVGVLREKRLPLIGNSTGFTHCFAYRVEDMIKLAVEQMAAHHRKRVALVGRCGHAAARQFQETANNLNLQWQAKWLQNHIAAPAPGEIAMAVQRIMAEPNSQRPDGLIVDDDTLFAEVATALVRLGIEVPDEVLVVTHANRYTPLPLLFPVVQVEADPDALAVAMADAMKKLLAGERVENETYLPYAVKSKKPFSLMPASAAAGG